MRKAAANALDGRAGTTRVPSMNRPTAPVRRMASGATLQGDGEVHPPSGERHVGRAALQARPEQQRRKRPLRRQQPAGRHRPADTLNFAANGSFTGDSGQRSSQSYRFTDSRDSCYSVKVTSVAGAVTAVTDDGLQAWPAAVETFGRSLAAMAPAGANPPREK